MSFLAPTNTGRSISFRNFTLDLENRELRCGDSARPMTPKPFETLVYLIEHRDRIVDKPELLHSVWGDVSVSLNTIEHAVREIRKVLGDSAEHPAFIKTFPRRGYRFIAPVEEAIRNIPPIPPVVTAPVSTSRPAHWLRTASLWAISGIAVLAVLIFSLPTYVSPETRAYRLRQITATGTRKFAPIAVDQDWLYYGEIRSGRHAVMRTPRTGGPVEILDIPLPQPAIADLSAGVLLLRNLNTAASDAADLWTWQLPAGPLRHLQGHRATDAVFDPTGKIIAAANGRNLTLLDAVSGAVQRRFQLNGAVRWPSWSADGRQIRISMTTSSYGMIPSSHSDLWNLDLVSAQLSKLNGSASGEDRCCGRWVTSGGAYLYQSHHGGSHDLRALDVKASFRSFLEPLLRSGPVAEGGVAGIDRSLYLLSDMPRIAVAHVGQTGELTSPLHGISIASLDVAPNGRIAYTTWPGQLWIAAHDGSGPERIGREGMEFATPRWSPEGSMLAASARTRGNPWGLVLVDALAKSVREVAREGSQPSWSPDGNKLIYERSKDAGSVLVVRDLATRRESELAESASMSSPEWSPVSDRIAAIRTDTHQLYLYELSGGRWSPLWPSAIAAAWSADGNSLHIRERTPAGVNLVQIDITGRETAPRLHLPLVPPQRRAAQWIRVTPEGLLLLEDLSRSEVFELPL